jgi:hypothetical protein
MSATTAIETCNSCLVLSICDCWNVGGSWKHKGGVNPCNPPALFDCPTISAKRDCMGCRIAKVCKLDLQLDVCICQ